MTPQIDIRLSSANNVKSDSGVYHLSFQINFGFIKTFLTLVWIFI